MWQQVEQRRLKEGAAKAKSFINNGVRLEKEGHALSAARSYIKAFSQIVPILYLNPQISHMETDVPMISHIDERMITLLNSMKFSMTQPIYRGTRASYKNAEPEITLKSNSRNVVSFPVIVGATKRFTNSLGVITVSKAIIDQQGSGYDLLLPLKTDIDQVIPSGATSGITRQWLSQMNWPTATAQIVFEKPSVHIETIENGYDDLPYDQLTNAIKERLGNIGYGIARFPEDAEYRIIVKSSTNPGGSMGSLYFTYLNISWTLYNKSGDELMTEDLPKVKGGALSYDDAGVKAFTKGSTSLGERIITWIKENN